MIPNSSTNTIPHAYLVLLRYLKKDNRELVAWHRLFIMIAVLAPSSGAVERLFSVLRQVFDSSNESVKGDYMSTGVKLRYNQRGAGFKSE